MIRNFITHFITYWRSRQCSTAVTIDMILLDIVLYGIFVFLLMTSLASLFVFHSFLLMFIVLFIAILWLVVAIPISVDFERWLSTRNKEV